MTNSTFSKRNVDIFQQIENAIAEGISIENAFEIFFNDNNDNIEELIPFTGYYSLDVASGSFVSIDTNEYYINKQKAIRPKRSQIIISVSLDGKTSDQYTFNNQMTFVNNVLTIPNVLQLKFKRDFIDGKLVTFKGNIGENNVNGFTRFNPVRLSEFKGTYFNISSSITSLTIVEKKEFTEVNYNIDNTLIPIEFYSYNPAMYVLNFYAGKDNNSYTLMLGTFGSHGLACSSMYTANGKNNNEFLVTIL
ncbi:hypothetical protein [Flavobacterium sp.]|uniref:hypothetical protein n=1 Tax=Flavobacterium sp. TaxID=239 RepID=UPI003D1175CB